jgi:hypothetical protein
MKITKEQLKQIIKEELEIVLEGGYDGSNEEQIAAVLNQYAPSADNPNGDYELAARILADGGIDRDEVNNYSQKLLPDEAMVKYAQNVASGLPKGSHPGYHD